MVRITEFNTIHSDGVAELYRLMGERFSTKLVEYWCKARKYVKVLLAVNDEEEVIGKVTLDLAYKPYAEIVNLMVHPDYRGQGIGSGLVEECIRIAESKGFHIQYLMADVTNLIAHRLYSKYGFIPVILPQKIIQGRNMWLYRFSKETFVKEFLIFKPFSKYYISKKRVWGLWKKAYRVGWADILSQDNLYLYFEGQPGQPIKNGVMPRINGVKISRGNTGLALSVHEINKGINRFNYSKFLIKIVNMGDDTIFIDKINSVALPHIEVKNNSYEGVITLNPGESKTMKFECRLTRDFDIPPLSFNTIVITIKLYVKKLLKHPILVSAGYRREGTS